MPPARKALPPGGPGRLRQVPWARIYRAGLWLVQRANEGLQQLTDAERRELGELLRRSRGRRRNLTQREAERAWALVRKTFPRL